MNARNGAANSLFISYQTPRPTEVINQRESMRICRQVVSGGTFNVSKSKLVFTKRIGFILISIDKIIPFWS